MWSYIAGKVLRNRILSVSIVFVITLVFGYYGKDVKMGYKYISLLPKDDPAYIDLEFFKDKFGEDGNVLIIGVQDSNFFKVDKFNDWSKLQKEIRKINGVTGVLSVSNVYDFEKDSKNKVFNSIKIFPDSVKSQKELDSLTLRVKNLPIYNDMVYFDESKVYFMAVTLDNSFVNSKKREELVFEIEKAANTWGEKYDNKMRFSGLPYTRTKVATMVKDELMMFIVMAMAVTAFILFLFFRSFKVVLFSSMVVGVGVVWSFGSIALFDYDITILTGMIPPLLIVIGIPNSVFLLNKFHAEFKDHGNKIKALHRVIAKVGNATFLTNLTTAVGFATFIFTGNQALVEFGIISSLNIMGVFILSITLIPVFFSFLPDPKHRHIKHLDYKIVGKIVSRFIIIVKNKRKYVYFTVFVLIIIAIYGVTKIKTLAYIIDDIPEDNPVYVDLKFFENAAEGVLPLEILISKKDKSDSLSYSTFVNVNKFEEKLKEFDNISKPLSLVSAFKFMNQSYYKGKEKYYVFPDAVQAKRLLPYLNGFNGNNDLLSSFIDSTFNTTRISLRVKDIGTVEMKKLKNEIDRELKSFFPEDEYYTAVTGSSFVFAQGTSTLVNNLFTSLSLAILIIAIFMASMFSSIRMIAVSLFPNILPLLFTAALMGYFNIAIKPSTILVFSIAFGISVDNAIHFLSKYRQELIVTDWNIKRSVYKALEETGTSVIYTVTILLFGFGIFTMSDFGGTVALGLLVSITLFFAMFTNLILLPCILLTSKKSITTAAFKHYFIKPEDDKEEIKELEI